MWWAHFCSTITPILELFNIYANNATMTYMNKVNRCRLCSTYQNNIYLIYTGSGCCDICTQCGTKSTMLYPNATFLELEKRRNLQGIPQLRLYCLVTNTKFPKSPSQLLNKPFQYNSRLSLHLITLIQRSVAPSRRPFWNFCCGVTASFHI
jgi:hypothetical protein